MQKTGKKKDRDPSDNAAPAAGKVSIVAQELKFAKLLASNDVKIRNGVLKSLKKWLNTRSQSSYRKFSPFNDCFMSHCSCSTSITNIQLVEKREIFFSTHQSTKLMLSWDETAAAAIFIESAFGCVIQWERSAEQRKKRKKVHGHPINPHFNHVSTGRSRCFSRCR